jgi:hypothetical protein
MSTVLPDPGPPTTIIERAADRSRLERTAAALTARGFVGVIAGAGADTRLAIGSTASSRNAEMAYGGLLLIGSPSSSVPPS